MEIQKIHWRTVKCCFAHEQLNGGWGTIPFLCNVNYSKNVTTKIAAEKQLTIFS
jgi:hypothetical protein